jgi:hypothetical protein
VDVIADRSLTARRRGGIRHAVFSTGRLWRARISPKPLYGSELRKRLASISRSGANDRQGNHDSQGLLPEVSATRNPSVRDNAAARLKAGESDAERPMAVTEETRRSGDDGPHGD